MASYIGMNQQIPADATTPIIGSISSNGILVSGLDTTGYNSISIQITGIWQAQVTFQTSNDNINWVNVQGYAFNSTAYATDTVIDNDIYILPVIGKYFQVLVTNYVSGTINTTSYLRSQSLAGIGEASLTQSMDQTNGMPINIGFQGFNGPGQQPAASSLPVALPNEQVLDRFIQGPVLSPGTVAINALSSDVSQYRSIGLQLTSTSSGTATFLFEGSNDGVNFFSMFLYNAATVIATPVTGSALTANATFFFCGPLSFRYFRVRVTVAVAVGQVQVSARLSMAPFTAASASSVLVSLNGTSPSTGGVAGSLAIGGITGEGVAPTMNPVRISGWDGTLARTIRTDTTGNVNVNLASVPTVNTLSSTPSNLPIMGISPLTAENLVSQPLNVRLERTTNGQDSVQDLLQQMLIEMKAQNYYLRELPMAIAVLNQSSNPTVLGVFGSMRDEPENFASDARNDMNIRGH